MAIIYNENQNFINCLNECLVAINKTTQDKHYFQPISSLDDIRDGKILAAIIEKFEIACGRRRRIKNQNYYQFIEDWLVTIGNMSYIPHYGNFVKHILTDCEVDLIANIFGIVAITMYNSRRDLWHVFSVEIVFLLLGEPLIPKISRSLNKSLNIEKDEKYLTIVQNRQLSLKLEQTKKLYGEEIEKLRNELRSSEETQQKVLSLLNLKLSQSKKKIRELSELVEDLRNKNKQLEKENLMRFTKIESLKDIILGNDSKTLISTFELKTLKQKISSMQDQIINISSEMDSKFSITI